MKTIQGDRQDRHFEGNEVVPEQGQTDERHDRQDEAQAEQPASHALDWSACEYGSHEQQGETSPPAGGDLAMKFALAPAHEGRMMPVSADEAG